MTLRIHHLNCGTMCPWCQRLVNGHGSWIKPAELVCHCLLIETPKTLVLVDTGIGSLDVIEPGRLSRRFRRNSRPRLNYAETAVAQIKAMGYSPNDVGHIVATHLDVDHAGGLPDFPDASVHVFKPELGPALAVDTSRNNVRYRSHHFAHEPKWVAHENQGDNWFGFGAIRVLPIAGADLLLIPLAGHTEGHTGVAVRNGEKWLLHCGDAYFHHGSLAMPPRVPPALRLFDRKLQVNGEQRLWNQARLRELAATHADAIDIFCAHDPVELRRLQLASACAA